MDSKKAEALIKKYWIGSASLEEEEQLKAFFQEYDGSDEEQPYFDYSKKKY